MDLNETPSTDFVTPDEDTIETETPGFGKELGKTLAVSTATSAGVFGSFVLIAVFAPKVQNWWRSRKSNVIDGEVEETTGTTEKD